MKRNCASQQGGTQISRNAQIHAMLTAWKIRKQLKPLSRLLIVTPTKFTTLMQQTMTLHCVQ